MVPALQLRGCVEHRVDAVLFDALSQGVRWVDHHGGRGVLLDDLAEAVEDGFCAAHLRGLHEDDLLRLVVAQLIHDTHQVGGLFVPPGAGASRRLRVQDAVPLRPFGDGQVLRRLECCEGLLLVGGDLVFPKAQPPTFSAHRRHLPAPSRLPPQRPSAVS